MKFTIPQQSLKTALNSCGKALSENNVTPINGYYLFDINPGKLTISACDNKIIISTEIAIMSDIKQRICIPGAKVRDYIGKLPVGDVLFEIKKHVVPAKTETVTYSILIASGKSECSISCLTDELWSPVKNDKGKPFKLPAEDFLEMLFKTAFAISDDGLRPCLTGLNIVVKGNKMTCTATDAHKLATYTYDIENKGDFDLVIPKETLQKIQSLSPAGMLDISIGKSAIDINWGEIKTTSLLIDEKYLDYKSVLPLANHIDFVTSRSELIGAINRIKAFSDVEKSLKLSVFSDRLELLASNFDYQEQASESIEGVGSEEIIIGCKADFLLAILGSFVDDKVWFSFSKNNRAMVITESAKEGRNGENMCLLMPKLVV